MRYLPLIAAFLLSLTQGQYVFVGYNKGAAASGLSQWLQSTACVNGSAGSQVQACTVSGTTYTFKILATTAGAQAAVGDEDTTSTDTMTISSAYECTTLVSGACTAGNAINTATLCPASACKVTNTGNDIVDVAFFVNESACNTSGNCFVTVTLSNTATSAGNFIYFQEAEGPMCGASLCQYSTTLDANTTSHATSCGSGCTGNSMTLSKTDMVFGFLDSGAPVSGIASPYQIEQTGNMFSLDVTSAPAWTITTTGYYTISELALKPTTAGSYTPASSPFSRVDACTPACGTATFYANVSCTPACAAQTIQSTTAGNLGVLFVFSHGSATVHLSSVADNKSGTWTTPAVSTSNCSETNGTVEIVNCSYNTSLVSATTTVTATMSTTTTVDMAFVQLARSTGSWGAPAAQGSTVTTSSESLISGQSLTVTTPAVCVQGVQWNNSAQLYQNVTYYPFPSGSPQSSVANDALAVGLNLNASSAKNLQWLLSAATSSNVVGGICWD